MLEEYFSDTLVLSSIRNSILQKSLENFVQYLMSRGHTPRMMKEYIRVAVHFIYWFENEGNSLPIAEEEIASRFYHEHLPVCCCPVSTNFRARVRAGVKHLFSVLRNDGHVLPVSEKSKTPIDIIIEEFEGYLKSVRGASASTCRQYTRYTRDFLRVLYGDGKIDFSILTVTDIMKFVTEQAKHHSCRTGTVKAITTSVRSFLQHLVFKGLCNERLVNAVPSIPHWKLASLPKRLNEQQLTSLLGAFDQSTSIGRRDHAIALCLIGLGLRCNEVAALCLDEIDWRKGVLRIHHGKGQRINLLPLSADIGRAIAHYIRHDRPLTQKRNVFVQHRPPIGESIKNYTIQAIIRRAFKRSGITTAFMGSHMLRHTAATRMIQAGVSIKEVADILGHRSINTTCIYAKVDLPTLSSVAMPWPEVQ